MQQGKTSPLDQSDGATSCTCKLAEARVVCAKPACGSANGHTFLKAGLGACSLSVSYVRTGDMLKKPNKFLQV